MSTVTLAPHVQRLSAGYKRSLESTGAPPAANVLSRPTAALPSSTPFVARTSRGSNETVPVAHTAYSRVAPGQIVFAKTYRGHRCSGVPPGTCSMVPVMTLDELNDLLADPQQHVALPFADRYRDDAVARGVYKKQTEDKGSEHRLLRLKYKVANLNAVSDYHPLKQYALQGVVCARSGEADCPVPFDEPVHECVVAVQGPSTFALDRNIGDRCDAPTGKTREPFFVKPALVLSKVFVVLVGYYVKPGTVKFQYEVVTQSHLDADPRFAFGSSTSRFRANLAREEDEATATAQKLKSVLHVSVLGTIMDTRFQRDGAAFVVNVRVGTYERTLPTEKGFEPVGVPFLLDSPASLNAARKQALLRSSNPPTVARRLVPGGMRPMIVTGDALSSTRLKNVRAETSTQ